MVRKSIKIKKGLFGKRSGNDLVILSQDEKSIFILNEAGARIWELLKEGKETGYIVEKLYSEYEAEKGKLKEEIEKFLKNIRKYPELIIG